MAARRRSSKQPPSDGPISVRLLGTARVEALHRGLATALGEPSILDPTRLESALAFAYDASSLGSSDCRAQAALVLLGFRELRPTGTLDPPLAFLSLLALLDVNGFSFDDVPFAEVVSRLAGLVGLRPEHGEAVGLHQWLTGATRPAASRSAPLPVAELRRLLEAKGFRVESGSGELLLLKPEARPEPGSWLSRMFRKSGWVQVHRQQEPADGVLAIAALRELRLACGLMAEPFLDDPAWQEGVLHQYRHLWPKLRGLWTD